MDLLKLKIRLNILRNVDNIKNKLGKAEGIL